MNEANAATVIAGSAVSAAIADVVIVANHANGSKANSRKTSSKSSAVRPW